MSSRKPMRDAAKRRKLEPRKDNQTGPNSATLESHFNLLNQGKFSDVTFIVGEEKERIPCHQLFLKARSSVFEVMFSERWNQEIDKEILLPDVEPKAFEMFLEFLYADIFEANVPEALELLQLANKYDVPLLVSKCEIVLKSKVTLSNAVRVFQVARNHENVQLMDKAGDLLTKSLPKLPTHPSFAHLDKETLMYVLKRKDLKMKEVDVFRLALQWARNQKDATVKESLEDILPLIRFPIMTLNEFTTAVVPTEILPLPTVLEIFKYFGSDNEAKKLLTGTLGFSTNQRQRIKADVYVSLYPEGSIFPHQIEPWYQLRTFKESMQFCIQMPGCSVGPQQPILGFGLRSIKLYHHASAPTTALDRTRLAKFKCCLQSKDCRDGDLDLHSSTSYQTLGTVKSFDNEQGDICNIDWGPVIALTMGTIYSITIERINSAPITPAAVSVQENNDTDPMDTVDVNFESIGRTTLTVRRNRLQGFTQDAGPHVICGLVFQEL